MRWIISVALLIALHAPASESVAAQQPAETATKNADPSRPTAKSAASNRGTPLSSAKFNENQYAKVGELTVRPSPISEINVPSPSNTVTKGVVTTKVTLFVDEKGAVTKIAFDDGALAQPFRDAVQNAFGKARFKPGRIGDRPVKARMRIEVTFEPKPEDAKTGVSRADLRR